MDGEAETSFFIAKARGAKAQAAVATTQAERKFWRKAAAEYFRLSRKVRRANVLRRIA